jgi:hypothetical protein
MIISPSLLLEQPAMFRCLEGLKSGSFLVRSHKVDTRIYMVSATRAYHRTSTGWVGLDWTCLKRVCLKSAAVRFLYSTGSDSYIHIWDPTGGLKVFMPYYNI